MEVVGKNNKKGSKDKESEDDLLINYNVDINGTIIPMRAIYTIKELEEYNYDRNKTEYYILLNEQLDGAMTVFSNIKIKCQSELHRGTAIINLQEQMRSRNHEFIKV